MDLDQLPNGYHQEEADYCPLITRDQYVAYRNANTRGTANPSVMNNPFWVFQVSPGRLIPSDARKRFENEEDALADSNGAVWCFTRTGDTRIDLPDGRVVCIGGEYGEDDDRDFCIYNGRCSTDQHSCHPFPDRTEWADVVVFDAPRTGDLYPSFTPDAVKIYGYPVNLFPPIDLHTSTFYADPATGEGCIFIIGGAGYADQDSRHRTEVYRLDLSNFAIHRCETSGEGPVGGTSVHTARFLDQDGQPAIRIEREMQESIELSGSPGGGVTIMPVEYEVFTLRLRDLRWI